MCYVAVACEYGAPAAGKCGFNDHLQHTAQVRLNKSEMKWSSAHVKLNMLGKYTWEIWEDIGDTKGGSFWRLGATFVS